MELSTERGGREHSGARSAERERENFGKVFLIRGERVSGIKEAYFICFALEQYSVLIVLFNCVKILSIMKDRIGVFFG